MIVDCPFRRITQEEFLQRYDYLEGISRGSQGSVCKAKNKLTGQFVAIKEYFSKKHESQQRYMRQETQALYLIHHENVLTISEAIMVHDENAMDQYYLVTELCDGDLGQIKDQVFKNYTLVEKLSLCLCLARGLQAIHAKNRIHRDLKPENIFYKGNVFKIGDLGLSREVDFAAGNSSMEMSAVGNQVYSEPEVFTGKYKPKCDIYSMGLIIYEIFMGQHLFALRKGEKLYEMQERFKKDFKKEISKISMPSPQLKNIIEGCLEKDYDKRYSAKSLRKSLEKLMQIEEKKSTISVETTDAPLSDQSQGHEMSEDKRQEMMEDKFEVEDLLSKLRKDELSVKEKKTERFIYSKLKMMEQIRRKMKALEGLSGEKDKKEAIAFSLLFYFHYWAASMERVLNLKESPFNTKYSEKMFVRHLSGVAIQKMKDHINAIFDSTYPMLVKMAEEMLKRSKLPEDDIYRGMIFDIGQTHCDRGSLLKYTEKQVKSFVEDTAKSKLGEEYRRANPEGALKVVRQIVSCFLDE